MEHTHRLQNMARRAWCIAMLFGAVALGSGVPLAGAQPRHYQVAVFTPGLSFDPVLGGLREGLARLHYVEGRNLTLTVEDTQGTVADLAPRVAALMAGKPDVFVSMGTSYTKAVKEATSSIPIVFTRVGDPLNSGLIASYASSQNNLTGISTYSGPLTGKRLELLQEIVPGIKRILTLVAIQEKNAQFIFERLAETAQKTGSEILRYDVKTHEEIENILRAVPPGSVEAIYHIPSSLVSARIDLLIQKAKQEKVALIVHEDSMVDDGALISYGGHSHFMGIQAAGLIDKILRGTPPAELPVQTPETLYMAVNLGTAKAINLSLPNSILERVDRLVE